MKSNNIYFNNVIGIGNLKIDNIIFDYEYPVLFTCLDNSNKLYLCVCCEIREEQRWIVTKVDENILIKLLSDEITIWDAFNNRYDDNYIIRYFGEGKEEKSEKVKFKDIDKEDLPTKGEYIEAEEGEFEEYIYKLKMREKSRITISITAEVKTQEMTDPSLKISYIQDKNCFIIFNERSMNRSLGKYTNNYYMNEYESSIDYKGQLDLLGKSKEDNNLNYFNLGRSTRIEENYAYA